MKARDLMSAFPTVVTPTTGVARAAEMMRDHDVGLLPVVEDERSMRLVGVITDRDITVRCTARQHTGPCTVEHHMTPAPIETVHPDDDVRVVLKHMDGARVRRLPVIDDTHRVLGLIAQADVIRRLREELPSSVLQVLAHVSEPAASLLGA